MNIRYFDFKLGRGNVLLLGQNLVLTTIIIAETGAHAMHKNYSVTGSEKKWIFRISVENISIMKELGQVKSYYR